MSPWLRCRPRWAPAHRRPPPCPALTIIASFCLPDYLDCYRIAAKLFKQDKQYKGQAIRLLSCSTGKLDNGFAQNLANKLNVPVQAPTDILWATPKGKYYVTAGKTINGRLVEDRSVPGTFRTFYPQRRKKK